MKKERIGIVITDGVGFRNFILSEFISESNKRFEEVIIFSCLPKEHYMDLNLNCKVIEFSVFKESILTWFFRKNKEIAHLQLHSKDNYGIQNNLFRNYNKSKNIRGFLTRLIFKWTKKFNSENWIQFYYKLQKASFFFNPMVHEYKKIFKENPIDLIFFTHQRPSYIAPIIVASESMKIKTATFIFSWDNLASKGRMAGNFNYFLVWSLLMKQDLIKYYPEIKDENINIVGTPQFESYVLSQYDIDKQQIINKFNLDTSKAYILYSCGDVSTSPNDPKYIEIIANAIIENKIFLNPELIVRFSPAEEPKRFEYLIHKYPFIKWNKPEWIQSRENHQESWSQKIPTSEDLITLKALLKYCNVSVNMLSTMSLDAMLFDKPVVNPVFGTGTNNYENDQKYLNYEHIKKVLNSGAVNLATNENALINAINNALQNPREKIDFQKQLLNLQIGKPLRGSSKRIVETLYKWM